MSRQRGRPRRFGPVVEKSVAWNYRYGRTMQSMAGILGCNRQTIRDMLKRQGVQPRRPGPTGPTGPRPGQYNADRVLPDNATLLRLRQTMTLKAIGDRYGVSYQAVQQALRRSGKKHEKSP